MCAIKCSLFGTIFVALQFSLTHSNWTCEENYCHGKEAPPDYPLEKITELVQELNWQSLGVNQKRQGYPVDLSQGVCERIEIADPIYQIIDENNKKRHVVQVEDRFLQMPHIVKCEQPGQLYDEKLPLFHQEKLDDFQVSCVNELVKLRFLVLSDDEQRLEVATVKDGIPLGCFCRYDARPKPEE